MTADAAHIAAALYLLAGAAVCLLMAWRTERRHTRAQRRAAAIKPQPGIDWWVTPPATTSSGATDDFTVWWDAWCRHFNDEITRGTK